MSRYALARLRLNVRLLAAITPHSPAAPPSRSASQSCRLRRAQEGELLLHTNRASAGVQNLPLFGSQLLNVLQDKHICALMEYLGQLQGIELLMSGWVRMRACACVCVCVYVRVCVCAARLQACVRACVRVRTLLTKAARPPRAARPSSPPATCPFAEAWRGGAPPMATYRGREVSGVGRCVHVRVRVRVRVRA